MVKEVGVRFSSKLSLLSNETVQVIDGTNLHLQATHSTINDNLQEDDSCAESNCPLICIEYSTKNDNVGCLITPRASREDLPIPSKCESSEIKNFGYTFKTRFIGDTKILSVTPTERQERLESNNEFFIRNLMKDREKATSHDNLRYETGDLDTHFKNKLPEKYTTKYSRVIRENKARLKILERYSLKSLKERAMNEAFLLWNKNLSTSERNRDIPQKDRLKTDKVGGPINTSKRASPKRPSKRLEKHKIHEADSLNLILSDKTEKTVPLEQIPTKSPSNVSSPTKLEVHYPAPSNENKQQLAIEEPEMKSTKVTQLFGSKELRTSTENNEQERPVIEEILLDNKRIDPMKWPSNLPKFTEERRRYEFNIKPSDVEKLVSFQRGHTVAESAAPEMPEKSKKYGKVDVGSVPVSVYNRQKYFKKSPPNYSTISKRRSEKSTKFPEAENVVSQNIHTKESQKSKESEKKSWFYSEKYLHDNRKELMKWQFLRNKSKLNNQSIFKKRRLGTKDKSNIHEKKFKFDKQLQLPKIARPKSTRFASEKSVNQKPKSNSNNQRGKSVDISEESIEIHGPMKLSELRKSLSKLANRQHKNSVVSQPELLKSSSIFNDVLTQKENSKSKVEKDLFLQNDLAKIKWLKNQLISLEKSDGKIEVIDTKVNIPKFDNVYSLEDDTKFTKKIIAPLTQSSEPTEGKPEYDTFENEIEIIKELGLLHAEDSVLQVLKYSELQAEYNQPFLGGEMAIPPLDYNIEKLYTEGESVVWGNSSIVSEQKLNSLISSIRGEEEELSFSHRLSDFCMKSHSESLQHILKDYLISNLIDVPEEMDSAKYTKKRKSDLKGRISSEFDYKYRGTYDARGLRTGFGCLHWYSRESRKYCGYFLYNSLHGKGHYFIKEDCLNFYNGYLYGNKLYGYGQIVYDNGGKFEGLFKDNSRFGPGVFTHPNNTQDIGIWNGFNLLRLNVDFSSSIPYFGKSMFAKIKLQQFKKVVPLQNTHQNKAKELLKKLNANEKLLDRYKELYNPHVRNEHSLFFDKPEYDETYFRNEECYIDIPKGWNRRKPIPLIYDVKKSFEYEDLDGERIELVKTIESIQTKLAEFRERIENLQNKRELDRSDLSIIPPPTESPDATEKNELYKEELFYSSVLDFLNYKLTTFNKKTDLGTPVTPHKARVESLLAWNNNEVLLDILLHTFRCRNSEENIRFQVKDIIMGERENFERAGEHEEGCQKFLEVCRSGDDYDILKLMVKQNINPDVCDSKGNTGLHFATCFDHVNIIKILANNGANLGIMNDEGLTPLNLALLRYLEIVYEVHDWEFAFLSKHEVTSAEKMRFEEWIPYDPFHITVTLRNRKVASVSSCSINANNVTANRSSRSTNKLNFSPLSSPSLRFRTPKSSEQLISEVRDRFVFSLDYHRKLLRLPSKTATSTHLAGSSQEILRKNNDPFLVEISEKLSQIHGTIETLLRYGADPNAEAVPSSAFFISLFTKSSSIVELFLKNNANPNQFYHGMTPLQVVCCIEPSDELCQIVNRIIHYSADVNLLADPSVWSECDADLCQDDHKIDQHGKNALHFVCFREDFNDLNNAFLCRMAESLLVANINTSRLYLGHSHLSIAVLKGNTELIKCLSTYVDIGRSLGSNLGNSLTVLALRRYPSAIPFHTCKNVIDCLFDLGISPFEQLYKYQNIFEFLDTDSPPLLDNNTKAWNAYVAHIKRFRSFVNQTPDKPIHESCNIISKIYIQEKSRSILDIIIRFKAVMYLYCFFTETLLNEHTKYLAKLIGNSSEALVNLEVIFRCGRLPQSYFSSDISSNLLDYVDAVNRKKKNNENKNRVGLLAGRMKSKNICDNPELMRIVKWVSHRNLIKCDVCYFCMRRTNKVLLRCPLCGIVEFCSKQCNYLSSKFKTIHACPKLFYHHILEENKIFISNNDPIPLYGIDLVFENKRNRECQTSLVQMSNKRKIPEMTVDNEVMLPLRESMKRSFNKEKLER